MWLLSGREDRDGRDRAHHHVLHSHCRRHADRPSVEGLFDSRELKWRARGGLELPTFWFVAME